MNEPRTRLREIAYRPEFQEYARGNDYAEALIPHLLDTGILVQELWQQTRGEVCPDALLVAAEWHDCDHLFPPEIDDGITQRRRLDTRSTKDTIYGTLEDGLKLKEHPMNCAAIFRELNPGLDPAFADDVAYLIERHEVGSTAYKAAAADKFDLGDAADVLCEADGLSFFRTILPFYIKQRIARGGDPLKRVTAKIKFSYEKLTPKSKAKVDAMIFQPVSHMGHTMYPQVIVESVAENIIQ